MIVHDVQLSLITVIVTLTPVMCMSLSSKGVSDWFNSTQPDSSGWVEWGAVIIFQTQLKSTGTNPISALAIPPNPNPCLSVSVVWWPVWEMPGEFGFNTPSPFPVNVFKPPSLIYSFQICVGEYKISLSRSHLHCFYHCSTNSVSSTKLYPQSDKDALVPWIMRSVL